MEIFEKDGEKFIGIEAQSADCDRIICALEEYIDRIKERTERMRRLVEVGNITVCSLGGALVKASEEVRFLMAFLDSHRQLRNDFIMARTKATEVNQ